MVVEVVIENAKGSDKKYELHNGKLVFDRNLARGFKFIGDYGFVPNTLMPDGDALDVLVLVSKPGRPKSKVKVKPIALMEMRDDSSRDDKIIAVHSNSKKRSLGQKEKLEMKYFFEHYKNNHVRVLGFKTAEKVKKALKEAKIRFRIKNVL